MKKNYVAYCAFNYDPSDVRIWGCCTMSLDNADLPLYFDNLNDLLEFYFNSKTNIMVYMNDMNKIGEFLLYWLFWNDFEWIDDKLEQDTFNAIINNDSTFYQIKARYKRITVTFVNSSNLIPLRIDDLCESKLKDIDINRNKNHTLTVAEKCYFKEVTGILFKHIKTLLKLEMTSITIGACAINNYKDITGKKIFNYWFPVPYYHDDIKEAFRGGFNYFNVEYTGKEVKNGLELDVNGLYAHVLYSSKLPFGEPIYFEGRYKEDKSYNIYVIMIRCQFELKKNCLPTIQTNKTLKYSPSEYLRSSGEDDLVLYLTNIDLQLFFANYHVYNIEYIGGYKFMSSKDMFKKYIEKWNEKKEYATENKLVAERLISKLMLVSLYGKFGSSTELKNKIPEMINGQILYQERSISREPIYIPIAIFVSSYARHFVIQAAQDNITRFIYSDTDSLFLTGDDIPLDFNIHNSKLGYWKMRKFDRAKFLKTKTYIVESGGKLEVTAAGMPAELHKDITWDNFTMGNTYNNMKRIDRNIGGVSLKNVDFTL